jgi:MYXO-CTERM domain-containing protein
MARNRAVYWLAGLGIAAILLLIGGMTTGRPAFAGFTPTPTPTETPTPTPTPTATPVPPPPPPPLPPPPPPTETPTPAPLLPEVGGIAPSPWPFLALGAAVLLAGWMVRRKRT